MCTKLKLFISAVLLSFASVGVNAQTDDFAPKTDSIINSFHEKPIDTDFKSGHDFVAPNLYGTDRMPDMRGIELKLFNPLVQPIITNKNLMFLGDYNAGGLLFPNIYAAGSQESIPGIGVINKASFTYFTRLNQYFDIQASVGAAKYNINRVGNAFDVSGMLTYHASDVLSFSVFGSYAGRTPFGIFDRRYGGTMGYKVSDKFRMEMGVQRVYDPYRGRWETVPIFIPSLKVGKVELGLDVGGLVYEILRECVFDKHHKNENRNMIIPPPI